MTDMLQHLHDYYRLTVDAIGASGLAWPLIVALGSGLAFWLLYRLFGGTFTMPTAEESGTGPVIDPDSDPGVFGEWTEGLANQIPETQEETDEFAQMLKQAGLYSPSARASIYALRFVLLFIPLGFTGVLLTMYPFEYTLRIVIGGGLAAAGLSIIPRLYVYWVRTNRMREIRDGLSDMMDMLSMCLSGGLPLTEALDHVAKNLANYPSLAEELRILRRQTEVGSLKHALSDFASRIDMAEVRQLSSMLQRGDALGMRLSNNLTDQADHFRSSRRQAATEQANEAPVKMVLPLMLCFAPAALIMLISPALLELREFINPPEGQENVLAGNQMINTRAVADTINGLDQGGTRAGRPGSASARAGQFGGGGDERSSGGNRPPGVGTLQGQGPTVRPPSTVEIPGRPRTPPATGS